MGWRLVAAEAFALGRGERGEVSLPLAGSLDLFTGRTSALDGYVTLGALEPKFWKRVVSGVLGGRILLSGAFDPPGVQHSSRRGGDLRVAGRRGGSGERFASEHDCCLEPVLELDEVLESDLVRARGKWSSSSHSRVPSRR